MKLTWQPTVGPIVTLGDDTANRTIRVEEFGGIGAVQQDGLFRAALPFLNARGNVQGRFVASVTNVLDSQDLAAVFMATEYARIAQQGNLAWARASTIFTFASSVLEEVTMVEIMGVRIAVRYAWRVGSLTVP